MTLSPKLDVVGISTLWHFRLPLPIQMFIKVASSPRLSGIGMPSPILWSHLLKMQRIVLLSSLLWWELGTNSLITGPGEWLSFRRFTSKLSWSWSSPCWCFMVSIFIVDAHIQFCCNISCTIFSVLSPYAFSICDTTGDEFSAYEAGGIATQVKTPTTFSFVSTVKSKFSEVMICVNFDVWNFYRCANTGKSQTE